MVVVLEALAFAASSPAGYRDDISFDVAKVPFSRYGSYFGFSHLAQGWLGEGLYLRSLHRGVRAEVLRVDLIRDGKTLSFREHATPEVLRLEADEGFVEICISEPYLIRLHGHGVGIRFSKPPDAAGFAFPRDRTRWEFNSAQQDIRFMLTAMQGNIQAKSDWDGTATKTVLLEFDPSDPAHDFDGAIEEFRSGWHERNYDGSFEDAAAGVRREYQQWLAGMPTVPDEFQSAANLAAYVDWAAVVGREGHLTRPAMLMSKNWMYAVWSWDHCFNAMALIEAQPGIAWDQYMLMFDQQSPDGALPDSLTDRELYWAYSKPPIHGWVLTWLMNHSNSINHERLAEAYPHLVRWTNWYFQFRDDDHDGLPQYDHGNDSGWDNSTVFRSGPVIETPDLASDLVLQMEALSNIAHRLGREPEAEEWKTRADGLLKKIIASYWRSDHFVALRSFDHSVIESDSLLLYIPIMLGKQLPDSVRQKMIADLKQPGQFLTSNGLATERVGSPYYESDGYWRGPIWAPSTMMIVDGLESSGEREFARELKLRYCRMAVKSGFSENFDAVSGRGLRDPAYTWSSSVFLILAHQLTQP
jgi:glycogen debranching enzyme